MPVFSIDRSKRGLGYVGLIAAVGLAATARAQVADPVEGKRLGGVTVTDTAIVEDEAETGYRVSTIRSATRTDTPLIDTPQSVSVVTAKQIEDQAANSIGDAIRYLPGVFSAQGEGNRETLVFRGNSTTGDFFVDGIRDDVQTYRDLYNIQRLEVFRGPNAMIFGRGGIGGVINRVTKVANWEPVREFRIEGGSYDHVRSSFDLGTALSDFAAVRLTGVYQDSGSYRDGVDFNRWGFNPTASFKLGPDTLVQIGYEHFKDQRVADRGVPAQFRASGVAVVEPLATPRGQFFGDPKNSPTFTDTDAGTLFIEHKFSEDVSIRNRTRYADYDKFYQNVFTTGLETVTVGVVTTPTGNALLQAYNSTTSRKNFFNQTDLNAEFDTGGIKHTLLVGAEYGRQTTDNLREEGTFPNNSRTFAVPTTASNIRTSLTWDPIASSTNNYSIAKVIAGYVQDQIELSPMFQIIAGIRYEHFNTKLHDRRRQDFRTNSTTGVVSPEFYDVTDNLWSPRAGLIFKPVENASVYASYSRTYQPRSGDQLAGLNINNQALAPEKFQNYEIGVKWDIKPGLNVSLAVYQLDNENVLVPVDPADSTRGTELAGAQRSRGVELGIAGNVTDALSIVGSYTYQDSEFTRAISASVAEGAKLPNAPRHSASLWTRYDVTPAIGGAVGVTYQGKRFASQDNRVVMPDYTRVDAALYYTVSENLDLQLNVENIFNERYFLFAHNNNNITPGSPTAFKAALSARF